MKVTFVAKCSNYLEAATLEEFLKKEGIQYEERINDGSTVHREEQAPTKKKPIKRPRMTAQKFSHIRNCIKQQPNWSTGKIKEHFDLEESIQTIQRVRNGDYDSKFISQNIRRVK